MLQALSFTLFFILLRSSQLILWLSYKLPAFYPAGHALSSSGVRICTAVVSSWQKASDHNAAFT